MLFCCCCYCFVYVCVCAFFFSKNKWCENLILKKLHVCVQVGVLVFRRYRNKNIKSMNFDNPVYRKTTTDDDKVYMEKTGSRQNLPAVRNLIIII